MEHKELYIGIGVGVGVVVLAGITYTIMKGNLSPAVGGTTSPAVGGTGEGSFFNSLPQKTFIGNNSINIKQIIDSNRRGAPSWVVRCLETGQAFMSQRAAALAMDLPESHISQHLNGVMEHVRGYHFERICLAA